jgi:hypothetical protein
MRRRKFERPHLFAGASGCGCPRFEIGIDIGFAVGIRIGIAIGIERKVECIFSNV